MLFANPRYPFNRDYLPPLKRTLGRVSTCVEVPSAARSVGIEWILNLNIRAPLSPFGCGRFCYTPQN